MTTEAENIVPGPSAAARKTVDILDKISDLVGKSAAVLVLPMMYVLGHEVISRYYFNAPTIWAGDLALIMYGIYFMVGSPYCLKEGMHIRTDFLYHRWSNKTKGLVDMIIYALLYIPTHIVFLEIGWKYFYKSFRQGEVIISSPWMPIIWPMKLAIPVGIFLMILQGVSETIKSYHAFRYGEFFWAPSDHSKDAMPETCELQP
jgi:TRAP-type mannitol/chloroaromatic compound transport system permease small subunit